jgi:hypothetical protein
MARLEAEHESKHGYYFGDLELNRDMTDDGINHIEVSVVKMRIRGEDESPYSDDEDEDDFADEVEDDEYHPREKTADDLAKERARERSGQAILKRERERSSKRRRLQSY